MLWGLRPQQQPIWWPACHSLTARHHHAPFQLLHSALCVPRHGRQLRRIEASRCAATRHSHPGEEAAQAPLVPLEACHLHAAVHLLVGNARHTGGRQTLPAGHHPLHWPQPRLLLLLQQAQQLPLLCLLLLRLLLCLLLLNQVRKHLLLLRLAGRRLLLLLLLHARRRLQCRKVLLLLLMLLLLLLLLLLMLGRHAGTQGGELQLLLLGGAHVLVRHACDGRSTT